MNPSTVKPWYSSIGVWGGIFSILAATGFTGVNIDFTTGDFTGNIYDLWASIVGIASGGTALYGRLVATRRIGKS